MLAQNFKTAADLSIEEWEWKGLIKVLGMLEREEFTRGKEIPDSFLPTSAMSFHMGCAGVTTGCGTVACIGGWVATLAGRRAPTYVHMTHSRALSGLYWPGDENLEATSAQAAIALRNYLTTGESRWAEAMAS